MSLIEVDAIFFVKCRLCLDETGQFQIASNIQMQMKYCFDIDVEPFDGLPQLICKKCQTVLSQYTGIKQFFQEKQKYLISKWNSGQVLIEDNQNSANSVQDDIENKNKLQKITTCKKNTKNLKDSSVKSVTLKTTQKKDTNVTWQNALYSKCYVCRFCSKRFKDAKIFKNHIDKQCKLYMKYSNVSKTFCLVKLNKIDTKSNFTGFKDKIVYNKNKVIDSKNANYYILYTDESKSQCSSNEKFLIDDDKSKINSTNSIINKDNTTNDKKVNEIRKYDRNKTKIVSNIKKNVNNKTKREIRPSNKKINKTIFINQTGKRPTSEKCINVSKDREDKKTQNVSPIKKSVDMIKTSNKSAIKKMQDRKIGSPNSAPEITSTVHHKTSNSIAGISHIDNSPSNSTIVKTEVLDSENSDPQITNTVKNISKLSCTEKSDGNCAIVKTEDLGSENPTPIITYTPHYKPSNNIVKISDKNFKIFTNFEGENCDLDLKRNSNVETCLKQNSKDDKFIQDDPQIQKNKHTKELKGDLDNLHKNIKQKVQPTMSNYSVSSKILATYVDGPELNVYDDFPLHNVLNTDGYGSKLLNANPVANPKKLPKKNYNEPKVTVKFYSNELRTSAVIEQTVHVEDNDMPYMPCQIGPNEESKLYNIKQKSALPRIQCKPTSDLMSVTALNTQNNSFVATTDWEMDNRNLNQNVMIQTNNVFYIPSDPYKNMIPVHQSNVHSHRQSNVEPHQNHLELNTQVQFPKNQYSFEE